MTDDDSIELSDQLLVTYILQQVVDQVCHCDLLYQDYAGDRDKYPFVTYNFIVPEQETTSDWLKDERQFLVHLQVDCHATSPLQAMTMANDLYKALHDIGYRRFFKQADIVPQQITNTSDRTTLEGINYDNDFGFDCSFVVSSGDKVYKSDELNFVYEPATTIKSARVADDTGGGTVGADKDKRLKEGD